MTKRIQHVAPGDFVKLNERSILEVHDVYHVDILDLWVIDGYVDRVAAICGPHVQYFEHDTELEMVYPQDEMRGA